MPFRLVYHHDVKAKDLPRISTEMRSRIKSAIENRLQLAPQIYGLPLRKTLKGYWKLRVGDYRVVFKVEQETILVYCISHRKDVYQVMTLRN